MVCIVVVEDEPDLLHLVREVLVHEGYETAGFHRPFIRDDLSAAPDLFLLDLMLPERTGIELAQELRMNGYAEIPSTTITSELAPLRSAIYRYSHWPWSWNFINP